MSWGKKTVPSAQASFETPPAGSHGAVLVAIIDLGTQRESFQGEAEKDQHKVYLCWELTSCPMSGTTNNHLLGRSYTFSLQEKAALRKLVKSWRGKDLADGEEFDILKMLGKPCMLSVSHKQNGDKVYAQLDGVSAVPAGMQVAPAKRALASRHVLDGSPPPDWLPFIYGEPVAEVIKRAREVRPPAATAAANGHAQAAAVPAAAGDEIPF